MSVYVDPLFKYGGSTTFRWTHSCHMYADSLHELHEFAQRLGLKRTWFQDRKDLPHYDLTPGKRALAVKLGATQTEFKHVVEHKRKGRDKMRICDICGRSEGANEDRQKEGKLVGDKVRIIINRMVCGLFYFHPGSDAEATPRNISSTIIPQNLRFDCCNICSPDLATRMEKACLRIAKGAQEENTTKRKEA